MSPISSVDIWKLVAAWPATADIIWFPPSGSRGGLLGTVLEEITWSSFSRQCWPGNQANRATCFGRGQYGSLWCGILSYDMFAGPSVSIPAAAPPRIFKILAGWRQSKARELPSSRNDSHPNDSNSAGVYGWFGPEDLRPSTRKIELLLQAPTEESAAHDCAKIQMTDQKSHYSFEELVQLAQADIRAGLYYQINLLKYFDIPRLAKPNWLLSRLRRFGGPQSLYLRCLGLEVASFSPERFVQVKAENSEYHRIVAQPIKGTAPRSPIASVDQKLADQLTSSSKELAELHMIVDLLRNDLGRVAKPGTVKVRDAGSLCSFATVHHLVATIDARLATKDWTIGEVLSGLCPAGSITGTPKSTAVAAIRQYEGQPRRYFMGNGFLMDGHGNFDSNILIRTLIREHGGNWTYAAGAGITIGSDPAAEAREVTHKVAVLTNPKR